MTRHILFLICFCLRLSTVVQAHSLQQLDSCLHHRPLYQREKEERIAMLKEQLHHLRQTAPERGDRKNDERMTEWLSVCNDLFVEYSTYQFDSAMVYAKKQVMTAEKAGSRYYLDLGRIHMVQLLATGGFYSQAQELSGKIVRERLDKRLRYEYFMALFWLYNFWAAYAEGSEFAGMYDNLKLENAQWALESCDRHSAEYDYLTGEIAYIRGLPPQRSVEAYGKAVAKAPMNTRLFASAAYGMARAYRQMGSREAYRQWLITAAMSDQMCPLKENLALQELAMVLYREDDRQLERASMYINVSMADARFYNNKLRMIEISHKLPDIVAAYQQHIDLQKQWLGIGVTVLGLMTVMFFASLIVVYRQNRTLHARRDMIEKRNLELQNSNRQLEEFNRQVTELNGKLENTARVREGYLKLFVDMSALAMERIANYKSLVQRKIKAGQVGDLLKTVNSDRISENELNGFLMRFDKSFLELYPRFIEELNGLLKPEFRLSTTTVASLTTELRILALIRLGVTESQEIATLLSYSPQTIYNYRTTAKNKAVDRERFDDDVRQLCKTL